MTQVKKPDDAIRILGNTNCPRFFLVYGPDLGVCEQIIEKTAKAFLFHARNLEITRFSEDDLATDFASFETSVNAASLFGNLSLAIIKIKNDNIFNKINSILDESNKSSQPIAGAVFIYSDNLTPKSKIVQAFDKSDSALLLRTFEPSRLDLINLIKEKAQNENVRIGQNAIDAILQNTNNDSQSIKAQVENLALYVDRGNEIDLHAVSALSLNSKEGALDETINAAFGARPKIAMDGINKCLKDGINPIQVLNTILRRVNLLNQMNIDINAGRSSDDVIKDRKFNIFWKEQENIKRQINIWSRTHLEKVLSEITKADLEAKSYSALQGQIIERLILRISQYSSAIIAKK